jgi:hypothetical protein
LFLIFCEFEKWIQISIGNLFSRKNIGFEENQLYKLIQIYYQILKKKMSFTIKCLYQCSTEKDALTKLQSLKEISQHQIDNSWPGKYLLFKFKVF